MAMYFVSGDQHRAIEKRMAEVMRRISGKGTTLNPELVLDRLQEMVELSANARQVSQRHTKEMSLLENDMFVPSYWKIRNVKRWNKERNWGFSEKDFRDLGPAPDYPDDRPFATAVLVPYLDTPRRTVDELRQVLAKEHWQSWLGGLNSYNWQHQELMVCGAPHEPGLRWEVIDMDGGPRFADRSNLQKSGAIPFEASLLEPGRLPHAGVLAELAHSPYWARSLSSNGGAAPGIWVPGYVMVDTFTHKPDEHAVVGGGEHLYVEAHSQTDSYAPHRESITIDTVLMRGRIGFDLATPVLL